MSLPRPFFMPPLVGLSLLLVTAAAQTVPTTQTAPVTQTAPASQAAPVATPAQTSSGTPTTTSVTQATAVNQAATSGTQPLDLTLTEALSRLDASPTVQQANLALERAQRDLDAARAALNLNVTVGGNAAYASQVATNADHLSGTLNLRATAGVLPWATNQAALATAQRALDYAKAVRQENIGAARLNAVQQYQQAYLAQLQLTAAQQNLQSAQQTLSAVQTQRSQQNATEEALLQAQAGVQSAQAGVQAAQNGLDTARRSLAATLGLGNALDAANFVTPPVLPGSLDNAGLAALGLGDVQALVTRAIAASSDVVKAQNNLADAQKLLEDQERNLTLPALTVGATYGKNGSGPTAGLDLQAGTVYAGYAHAFGNTSSSTQNSLNVSLNGSYSVFNPAGRAQIASTQAQITQTQLSLILERQNAELAVRQKYSDTLTALGAVAAKATLEERARVNVQSVQARLSAGVATQNDLLSAQAAYAQAKQDTQAARAAASVAIIQLQNLAGGAQ